MSKKSAESLFNKMYGATKDALNEMKRPLEEKNLRRKFQAQCDATEMLKIEAEQAISASLENLKSYDLVGVLKHKQTIADCEKTIAFIKAHYLEMFGEEMA